MSRPQDFVRKRLVPDIDMVDVRGHKLTVSFGSTTQDDLGHDTVAEHDQNKDSKELCEGFPEKVTYLAPGKIRLGLYSILLRNLVVDERSVFSKSRNSVYRRVPVFMVWVLLNAL